MFFFLPLHHQKGGAIAQLVERRTENPQVTGSTPVSTTKKVSLCRNFFLYNLFGCHELMRIFSIMNMLFFILFRCYDT